MKRVKYSLIAGLIFGIIVWIYCIQTAKQEIGIVMGLFCFITFSLFSYFNLFFGIKNDVIFKSINKTNVLYSGLANHIYNGTSVGGTLYLTNEKLIFQTNLINFIQKHECIIELKEISNIDFENTMQVINNGFIIETKNSETEKFIVNKRHIWKKSILNQIDSFNIKI